MKQIVSIGSPNPQERVPDTLVFLGRNEQDSRSLRSRIPSFAFDGSGSGSTTSTAIGGSAASPEYVQAELMNENFPQDDDYLWKEALKFTNSEKQLSQAHQIQQAYREWCEYYDKIPDKVRLGVFASNFVAVKDFHERTGKPLIMNEHSDLTEDEWLKLQHQAIPGDSTTKPTQQQSDLIHKAYWEWCHYYGKIYDEQRFKTFTSNFLAVQKYHQQTKKELVLNEFADMTEGEYQKYLQTSAHFVTSTFSTDVVSAERVTYKVSPPPPSQQVDPITSPLPTKGSAKDQDPGNQSVLESVSERRSHISSLSEGARSLEQDQDSSSSSIPPEEQPLDSLVIDVLKKQSANIADLQNSVEDIQDVQVQSGELIQLVSQNQVQMSEMMNAMQTELEMMQKDLQETRNENKLLKDQIRRLEDVMEKLGVADFLRSLSVAIPKNKNTAGAKVSDGMSVLAREMMSGQPERISIQPNPIGLGMSMFAPRKPGAATEDYTKPMSTSHTLENKRRSMRMAE